MPGRCGEPACPNTGVAASGCGAGAWGVLACDISCVGASAWEAGVAGPSPLGGRLGAVSSRGFLSQAYSLPHSRAPHLCLSPPGGGQLLPGRRPGRGASHRLLSLGTKSPRPRPCPGLPGALPHKQPKTTLLPADFPVGERSG